MERDLFEDLRKALGCLYISDIRSPEYKRIAIETARLFTHEDYGLRQWEDLCNYLDEPDFITNKNLFEEFGLQAERHRENVTIGKKRCISELRQKTEPKL